MTVHDENSGQYRTQLREAIETEAAAATDWTRLHARLGEAVAARLGELRRRTSGAYRATAGVGAAWWDYTAGAAIAAVPLGLAAALLLFAFLRSGASHTADAGAVARVPAVAAGGADSARAAFESVLTGVAAPQSAMAALIPVPSAAFLAESAAGSRR